MGQILDNINKENDIKKGPENFRTFLLHNFNSIGCAVHTVFGCCFYSRES